MLLSNTIMLFVKLPEIARVLATTGNSDSSRQANGPS